MLVVLLVLVALGVLVFFFGCCYPRSIRFCAKHPPERSLTIVETSIVFMALV